MDRRRWLVPLAALGVVLLYRRLRHGSASETPTDSWEFSGPMAKLYDHLFGPAIDGVYERIARQVGEMAPRGNILDVECGPGRLAIHLVQETPGGTVTGIDISPDMIALAKRRAEGSNLTERLNFQVADVGALPFADNTFDLVVSTLSLHHWPDPVRGLAEIRRVLKPTGHVYIYDVADWIFRLTHHGIPQATILAKAPFAFEPIEAVWSVGPVPIVTGFRLEP